MIRDGSEHKIGVSINPQARLKQVASSDGMIVHLIPSREPYAIEKALHRHFSEKRLQGEWFALSQEDVDEVCQLGQINAIDDLPDHLSVFAESQNRRPSKTRGRPKIGQQHSVRLPDEVRQLLDDYYALTGYDYSATIRMVLSRYLPREIQSEKDKGKA